MLILGVGLWDDIMGMRPRFKFARADRRRDHLDDLRLHIECMHQSVLARSRYDYDPLSMVGRRIRSRCSGTSA